MANNVGAVTSWLRSTSVSSSSPTTAPQSLPGSTVRRASWRWPPLVTSTRKTAAEDCVSTLTDTTGDTLSWS